MAKNYESDAKVFKALCDEKRLAILELLRDGEKCACVLSDITCMKQSALSYHMKILCESGIINARQSGKWTHYSIDENGCKSAVNVLKKLTTPNIKQTHNNFYLNKIENPSA